MSELTATSRKPPGRDAADRAAPNTLPRDQQSAWYVHWFARVVGVINAVLPRRGVVVCCAPVPEANRGDQALLLAVARELEQHGFRPIHLVETATHPIESIQPGKTFRIHRRFYEVFNTVRSPRERLAFLRFLLGKRYVVLVGADVLDEGYSPPRSIASLNAMRLVSLAGVANRIIGFSINDTSSATLGTRLRLAHDMGTGLYARDKVTWERVRAMGIDDVKLTSDLALLMPPAEPEAMPDDIRRWFDGAPGKVVGLNFTQVVMGSGAQRDRLFEHIAASVRRLSSEMGLRFLLIPHDEQGGREYLHELKKVIDQQAPDVARMVDPIPSAPVLKRIAGTCRHVFTCRLHLGLATLGMGRPVTGFPYQGKWEGPFEAFGVRDALLPVDELPDDPDGLTEAFRRQIDRSEELARRVQERLPGMMEQARLNLEGMSP